MSNPNNIIHLDNYIAGDLEINNNHGGPFPQKVGSGMDDRQQSLPSIPSQSGEGSANVAAVAVVNSESEIEQATSNSSSKKEKHVDFIDAAEEFIVPNSSSSSREKVARSGSMFVRISNTSVDRERMEEFEKLDKMNDSSSNTSTNVVVVVEENRKEEISGSETAKPLLVNDDASVEQQVEAVVVEPEDAVILTEDNQSDNNSVIEDNQSDNNSVTSTTEKSRKFGGPQKPQPKKTTPVKVTPSRIPPTRLSTAPATSNRPVTRGLNLGPTKKVPPPVPVRAAYKNAAPAKPIVRSNYNTNSNSAKVTVPSHKKHLQTVEILGRKVEPVSDKSPYACKIIEIPPDTAGNKLNSTKLLLCPRDRRVLEDQVTRHEKEKIEEISVKAQLQNVENWLFANPQPYEREGHQKQQVNIHSTLVTQSVPLKSWPQFLQSNIGTTTKSNAVETQTCVKDLLGSDGENVDDLTATIPQLKKTGSGSEACNTDDGTPMPQGTSNSAEEDEKVVDEANGENYATAEDTEIQISPEALEEIAEKVERGIFTVGEACNVLINTVFKDSLRNPASLEKVLECEKFQEFINAPNEINALEQSAILLTNCCELIQEYLKSIKRSGVEFPSCTNFLKSSKQVVSVTTSKRNVTLAAQQAKSKSASVIWSFVPPTSPEKFQLAFFFNPENGEIMQTITCQEHVFRTRYSTTPLDSQVQQIISASREQIGLPGYVKPENLLDTIDRCSAAAAIRLVKAKAVLSKCSKQLYRQSRQVTKSKFQITTTTAPKNLDTLKLKLQQFNIFAGIMYQMCSELHVACKNVQSGIWNSMYLQDALKFPRIPGFPNKECRLSTSTKIQMQDAMSKLVQGIREIDSGIRLGQFSLETVKFGVNLGKEHRRLVQEFLEGVQMLGSDKDIDYGTLLITLLCSTEMINHFEEVIPSVDKYKRASILQNLARVNWGTAELLGIVKRMEDDTKLLAMRTTFKLRELRNRYRLQGSDF